MDAVCLQLVGFSSSCHLLVCVSFPLGMCNLDDSETTPLSQSQLPEENI